MKGTKLIILALIMIGCEDLLFEKQTEDTPIENFDHLWQACNDRYAFFDLKGIDWDEYYRLNRPLVSNRIGEDSLFNILSKMLNALEDGHVNLIAPFNRSRFDISLLGPVNFDWQIVKENYIGPEFQITGPLSHNFLADRQVGYIRYNSFQQNASNYHIGYTLNRYRATKGLIIDIRSNGGGSLTNAYRLLDYLHREKVLLYTSQLKNGPGKNDFTDPIEIYSSPHEYGYPRRVIILTDRQTYSASSFFTLAAKSIPNMTVIGDTTGGGLGLPNGGQLPNGWTYRFSITKTLDPQGNNYENGVPPDIVAIMRPTDRLAGRDVVIDEAIQMILSEN